jgi:hypothetical protein
MARYEFTEQEWKKMSTNGGATIVARDSDDNGILGVFIDMDEFRKVYPSAEIVNTEYDYNTMIIWC